VSNKGRAAVSEDGKPKTVRLSVPLDRHTHAKLVAKAAIAGKDRSELAAAILKKGLVRVTVTDPDKGVVIGEPDGSTE
jgi:hypothetical protein